MAKAKVIDLKPINVQSIEITIIGDSPLIMHRWDEKSKKQMLDKQMKKTVHREAKNPEEQFQASIYHLDNGDFGFPADGFKASAVRGGKACGVVMTDAKGAFFVNGIYSKKEGRELVPIKGKLSMREDMVRLESGVADIHFRGQLEDWKATFTVSFNASVLSAEQIVNMFQAAGFGVGLGEWRPQKNGMFGRFHVDGSAK
jgi:hypothetical protein